MPKSKAPRDAIQMARELRECVRAWRQADADAEAILNEYDRFIENCCDDVIATGFAPMLFSELVKGCTDDERTKLAHHLAAMRSIATMQLASESLGDDHGT